MIDSRKSQNAQPNQKQIAKKSAVPEGSSKQNEKQDDLLGTIFEGQNLLLGKSGKVVVRRDGSLEAKKLKIEESSVGKSKSTSPTRIPSASVDNKAKIASESSSVAASVVPEPVPTSLKKEKEEKFPETATVVKQSDETVIGDECNRKISLDNRIEALAAAQKVTPRQLPYSIASQLGLRDVTHNVRRKQPLLPHPTAPTNESYAELITKVLQSGPPPPPPPPPTSSTSVSVGASSLRQVSTLYSRPPLRPNMDSLPMDSNVPLLVGGHTSVKFSPSLATSNALFANFNIPPPPPSVVQPPTSMNTYAAPAFLAGVHRSALPARLPFPFGGQDLNQPKFVVPSSSNEPFLVGPSANQQLSAFRWTVPSTAIRLQTPTGPTVVHVPSYPQVSLPFLAQQTSAGAAQASFQAARQNLLMNQYAAVVPPDFSPFALHNATEQSSRVNSYGVDVQALTGSGLYMHHPMLQPIRNDDDIPPAAPEVKTPVSITMPPEEPTVPPPPSPSVKLDLKDPSIPQELLGLLAQFAQMKNEQNQRESMLAAKKIKGNSSDVKPLFEPTPVKKPELLNAPNASPQILPMQISNDGDSPFSPASSSSGGAYSPEDNTTQASKPVRTVQFHPEVEDKNNERLSKREKRQLKSEEKLKSLLSRTTMVVQNNTGINNDDDLPSSAVDLSRRERVIKTNIFFFDCLFVIFSFIKIVYVFLAFGKI